MFFKKDITKQVIKKMLKEKKLLLEKYKLIEEFLIQKLNRAKDEKKKEELRGELRDAQKSIDELDSIVKFLKTKIKK
jgi:hypothetical protein